MSVARHLTFIPLVAVMAISGIVAIAWPNPARGAAVIVVDTTADEDIDNASCSLREAIIAANTNASYHGCSAGAGAGDTIVFDLGAGTPTINIGGTPLPAITEWVTIDGGTGRVELHGPGGPPVSGNHGLTVKHGGSGTIIRNLVVNNSADDGIFIDADEVSVLGCFIGTDAAGTKAVPNQGYGVQVFGGNGVRIGGATSGGPCTGDCNVLSGATNFKANLLLDLAATEALVRGNFIGTDVTGTTAVIGGSNGPGVIDKGSGDRIGGAGGTTPGGSCTGDCNLISGNGDSAGILVDQAATGSLIQGNFIGTDFTGTNAINFPGNLPGIMSFAAGTMIGGTTSGARNVVSGNLNAGIEVEGLSATVQGNYIGTNSAGTAAVGGGSDGVFVYQADGAMIGGTAPGAGNLISGASPYGTGVDINQSTNTQVVGNLIGTAADGSTPLPNYFGVGISNQSSNNTVGGPVAGAGNTIAFNAIDGVSVDGGAPQVRSNAIRGNSIYSNGAAGIVLADNANDNLAPPTIEGVGPLHGTACAPCTVEIFSDSDDQGRIFEGSVFTNDGNWTFNGPLNGPEVTATNTDMSNNTSEFSAPFSLTPLTPTASPTLSPTAAVATSTATATNTPTEAGTATTSVTPSRTPTMSPTSMPTFTNTPTRSPSVTPPTTLTATATPIPTAKPTATNSTTETGTPTTSATPTPSPTSTAVPTPRCIGDCDGSGTVTVDDLITLVNIALGKTAPTACPHGVPSGADVDVALIIRAVNSALNACS